MPQISRRHLVCRSRKLGDRMTRHITSNHCIFAGVPRTYIELECIGRRDACSTGCESKFLHHSGQLICSPSIQRCGNQQGHVSNNLNLPQFDKSIVYEASLMHWTSFMQFFTWKHPHVVSVAWHSWNSHCLLHKPVNSQHLCHNVVSFGSYTLGTLDESFYCEDCSRRLQTWEVDLAENEIYRALRRNSSLIWKTSIWINLILDAAFS